MEQGRLVAFLDENSETLKTGKKRMKVIKPDFYLPDYELDREHWGIIEGKCDASV